MDKISIKIIRMPITEFNDYVSAICDVFNLILRVPYLSGKEVYVATQFSF